MAWTDTAQAISSIVQALAAVAGFILLRRYTTDTGHMRRASDAQTRTLSEQLEAGRMPFFLLTGLTEVDKELCLENVGIGVALNIKWSMTTSADAQGKKRIGSLAPKERRWLLVGSDRANYIDLIRSEGMRLTFSDIAGKRYWLTFRPVGQGKQYITHTEVGVVI